jgi:recombinational DNA repair protein RecT
LIRAYEQRRQTPCPQAIVQLDNGLRKTTLMPKEPIAAHNRRAVSDTPPNKSDDEAQ